MCIIVFHPANTVISREQLDNCNSSNPHGCGFSYINTDFAGVRRLKIEKSMDYEVFLKKYERATRWNPESPFIIHFRYATHGTKDKYNCHPFRINKNLTMVHNGVISSVPVDPKKSDTQMFNDMVLKNLPKSWDTNAGITFLLEKFLGGSKMVTLDINGHVNIYNESHGHWSQGVWYSNHSYKKVETKTYPPYVPKPLYQPPVSHEMFLCDGCMTYIPSHSCNFYAKDEEPLCYCSSCRKTVIDQGDVVFSMGISKYKYELMCDQLDFYTSYKEQASMCGFE